MPTKEYSATPEEKMDLWRQIIEAAQVVIDRGGADIKLTVDIGESERLYREMRKNGTKKRTD